MSKIFASIAVIVFTSLIAPTATAGQTAETIPITVCADAKKSSSCLTGDNVIRTLYGRSLTRASLGWKVRNDLFLNPIIGKLIEEGEIPVALFIVEEVAPDPNNNNERLDGHASAPRMTIALFNWLDGAWKLSSHTKGLAGVGAWGHLNVDGLIVHVAGNQQYFLEIPSGYMGQGIIESFSSFYANFAVNGKPSPAIKELGSITTSVDGCGSGIKDQVHEEGQLVVSFKEQQYPDLILYRTQGSCEGPLFKKTLPPEFFIFDKKSDSYRPKNKKN